MKPHSNLRSFGNGSGLRGRRNRGGANHDSWRHRRLQLEPLEQRQLLSVVPPLALQDSGPMLEGFDGQLELDGDSVETGTRVRVFDLFDGTWADAEKDLTSGEDDLLCWAATASNMLEWTSWGFVNGMYKADQMLDYFENHWLDSSGFANDGNTWWFDGAGTYGGAVDVAGGGFHPGYDPTTYIHVENNTAGVMSFIRDATAAGSGMGISIGTSGFGHAITVWGYNYDNAYTPSDPEYYLGLWVSDSDDNKNTPDAYTAPNDLHYYGVSWNSTDGWWELEDYSTSTIHIGRAYSLDRYDNGIVTLNGDQDSVNQADAIEVRLDSTGMYLEVEFNGSLKYSSPLSQVDRLNILGWGGNDTLTVDYSNGNPVPAGGIMYDGGTGGDDALSVGGNGEQIGSYLPGSAAGDGVVEVNGSVVTFTGLEPVTVSGMAEFTFVTPNSNDVLSIDSPVAGRNRISGTSGNIAFESLSFYDVDHFKIDTATHDDPLGNPNDVVMWDSDLVASGLVSFTVGTGEGDDVADATSVTTMGITVLGGDGNDSLLGGAGDERLEGGDGQDQLYGFDGNDVLLGGAGADELDPGDAQGFREVVDGGDGTDQLRMTTAATTVDARESFAAMELDLNGGGPPEVVADDIELVYLFCFPGGPGAPVTVTIDDLTVTSVAQFSVDFVDNGAASTLVLAGSNVADDIAIALEEVSPNPILFPTVTLGWGKVSVGATDAAEGDTIIINALDGDDRVIANPNVTDGTSSVSVLVTVNGGAGNDYLSADATLNGGDGDDVLVGSAADDTFDGGAGDDTIIGNGGTATVTDGAGTDTILVQGTVGNDTIDLSEAAGVLTVTINTVVTTYAAGSTYERVLVETGEGDDTVSLSGTPASTTVDAGAGNDYVDASGVTGVGVILLGGAGDDTLIGGDGADRLEGGDGLDSLYGRDGNDTLLGGTGADKLDPGGALGYYDVVDGGDDPDQLNMTTAATTIHARQSFAALELDLDGNGFPEVVGNNIESVFVTYSGAAAATVTVDDLAATSVTRFTADFFDSGAASTLVVNGSNADDNIAVALERPSLNPLLFPTVTLGWGKVSTALTAAAEGDTLVINALDGDDRVTINPNVTDGSGAASVLISVDGGNPSASDVLAVEGVDATVEINVAAGTITGAAADPISFSNFEGVEVAAGASTMLSVIGADDYTVLPEASTGRFTLLADGLEIRAADYADLQVTGAGSNDSLLVEGTPLGDVITVAATTGAVTLAAPVNLTITPTGVENLLIEALEGDDVINLNAPLSAYSNVAIRGGDPSASDVLNLVGDTSAVETVTIAPNATNSTEQNITGLGATINASGVELITYAGGDGAGGPQDTVVVDPGAGDDTVRVQSGAPALNTDLVTSNSLPAIEFTGLDTFAVDANSSGGMDEVTFVTRALQGATPANYQVFGGSFDTLVVEGSDGAVDSYLVTSPASGSAAVSDLTSQSPNVTVTGTGNLARLQINTLGGDDTVTVDVGSTDIVPTPITFDGGGGSDTLFVSGTPATAVDEAIYSPGPAVGEGRLAYEDASNARLMTIDFVNLEPVVDLVVANTLTVNGTDADNAINYTAGSPDNGLVTVDGFESIEFSNKDHLVINARSGDDVINLNNPTTPTSLTDITVNGGDPTGSDKVVVNGTSAGDAIGVAPTAADAAQITIAGLPDVIVTTTESLVINGQGGDDSLTVITPAGFDEITYTPGPTVDSATVQVASLVPLAFTNLGAYGAVSLADTDGARTDRLYYIGTALNDYFNVVGASADIELNGQLTVSTPGVQNIVLSGLDGNDQMVISSPQPDISITVSCGGADNGDQLTVYGQSGVADVFTLVSETERGSGVIMGVNMGVLYYGVEDLRLYGSVVPDDTDSDSLTVLDNATDNTWRMTTGPCYNSENLLQIDDRETIRFETFEDVQLINVGGDDLFRIWPTDLTINTLTITGAGTDVVEAVGTAAADTMSIASGGAQGIVNVNGVSFEFSGMAAANLVGLQGQDVFNVEPFADMAVFVDGGDPIGVTPGDQLNLLPGFDPVLFEPGPESDEGSFLAGANQRVSFDHIEGLSVTGPSSAIIVGTNGDDDITVIARDDSTHAPTDGQQDFTVSINASPEILFVDVPTLYVDGLSGDDDIVIRTPAPNGAEWNVDVFVAGGPPSASDRLVLETPGDDDVFYTPTGFDSGVVRIDETTNDSTVTMGSFDIFWPGPEDVFYRSSPGGIEQFIYDGEDGSDNLTVVGDEGVFLSDSFLHTPGAAPDAGRVVVGNIAQEFLAVDYVDLGLAGVVTLDAGEGTNTVCAMGTTSRDEATVSFSGAGSADIDLLSYMGFHVPVRTLGAVNLIFDALAGDDSIYVDATVDLAGRLLIRGGDPGGSDALYIVGESGVDETAIIAPQGDYSTDQIITGLGASIDVSGIELVNFGGNSSEEDADTLVVRPGAGDHVVRVEAGSPNGTDLVTSDSLPAIEVTGMDRLVVDGDAYGVVVATFVTNSLWGANNYQFTGYTEDTLVIEGIDGRLDSADDNFTVTDGATGRVEVTDNISGVVVTNTGGTLGRLQINTLDGDDTLTVDAGSTDVVRTPITFDGGGGSDRLVVSGTPATTVHEVIYTPGPAVGEGRLLYENASNARLMTIDFVNLEPVLDVVPAAMLTVNATNAANTINYTQGSVAANGLVSIDGFEVIEFSLKTGLTIDALAGNDVVNLDNASRPTSLSGITVLGRDGNDTVTLANLPSTVPVTVYGGGGNDLVDGSSVAAAALTLNGEAGNDTLIGGGASDTLSGGAGDDMLIGNAGNNSYNGGAGFDTIGILGTLANDRIDVRQTNATTLVSVVNGDTRNDTFTTVEAVRIELNRGDDILRVAHDDSLVATPASSLRIEVLGGDPNASDRLAVVDDGLGDLVLYRKGVDDRSGSITVGPLAPVVFEQIEYVDVTPLDGVTGGTGADGLGRLVVFKHDPFENNNALPIATYLGSGAVINVDPTVDPGGDDIFELPGDWDWYRVVAAETGTLDFQVYFEEIAALANGRAGLPGNGNLDIEVYDVNGTLIAGGGPNFGANDGAGELNVDGDTFAENERIRIPAVAGQTYYLRVFGHTDSAVNIYNMTVVNEPAPVPYDLELDDIPVGDPPPQNSDTGRSQFDNVTRDNTPVIVLRLDDARLLHDLPGNPADGTPPDEVIPIPFNPDQGVTTTTAGYRVAIFDEGDPQQPGQLPQVLVGYARQTAEGVYEFDFDTDALDPNFELTDGSHFLSAKVEMIDPADPTRTGLGARSVSLEIVVDTEVPPACFGETGVGGDGLHPDSDSGIEDQPDTFVDRITNDTTPSFWGIAEANSIIRVYADLDGDGELTEGDLFLGETVTIPLDGTNQFPRGQWNFTTNIDMNDPAYFPTIDGIRTIFVTAEDLAGNVNTLNDGIGDSGQRLDIFIDTRGPQVEGVSITGHDTYDLFDPKPSEDGPTPLVYSLDIDFVDRPPRGEGGTSGGATAVDVFLLFDDTGSFAGTAPLLIAQFPQLIASLQAALPGVSLAFGVGRFEEYGSFASENADGRPFILNQPILEVSNPQFNAAINAALNRTAPGYGGDGPETSIEALYQVATGAGFDGNGNGSTTESGAAGLVTTQTTPGSSGDVPAFSSFTADPSGPVVASSGSVGGVGFRDGAVRLVLLATDIGFAFEPDAIDPYLGVGGVTVPAGNVQYDGRGTTPGGRGAEIQATVDALIAAGIQVIGLGTGTNPATDPRLPLESISILTGALNNTGSPIESGVAGDPIEPGEPLFFYIDPSSGQTVAAAITAGVTGAVSSGFLYPAVNEILATTPGNIQLVGDANGIIPIQSIEFLDHTVAGDLGRTTIRLHFYEPLPDDRYTLTVLDDIMDNAANPLDGQSNAAEPQENPSLPSGDGQPGGDFTARFTIDSRPEIGTWGAGSVWVDTNGNSVFDPDNLDFTNRDIIYTLAYTSDNVFCGNFAAAAGDTADGFDKLAAYGKVGTQFRWLIDTDNDGVPNLDVNDPAKINGLPVAGNFDGNSANGDEVGLFTGSTWWLDTNHDFKVDKSVASAIIGYPIVGDFDGDGHDALGTYCDAKFSFQLWNGATYSTVRTITTLSFIGVRERPVAADIDQDGIDDIGLWTPDRSGATPEEACEWYFLISDDHAGTKRVTGSVTTLDHEYTPVPFGKDTYARFGDEYAMPLVGNFDPPATVGDEPMPTGTVQLSTTLVSTPTAVGALGEIDVLPASDPSIDEWDTYWVELWVDTAWTSGVGVGLVMADLAYNTDCFTPTEIEYGPAFTENQIGVVDDAAGVIRSLGASTPLAELGNDHYVLVARVRFEPIADGPGLLISPNSYTPSGSCDVDLQQLRVALSDELAAKAQLADLPSTKVMPMVYDLDDDGQVGLGDLSYFAAAYGRLVGTPSIAFTYASDFDYDGQVGLGDLSYFAAAYGRSRYDGRVMAAGGGAGESCCLAAAAAGEPAAAADAAMAAEYDDSLGEDTDLQQQQLAFAYSVARRSRDSQKNDSREEEISAVDLFFADDQ